MTGIVAAAGGAAAAGSGLLNDPGTQNYSAVAFDPTDARSGVRINANGDVEELQNFTYFDRADWIQNPAAASLYEVQVTVQSGTLDFGLNAGQWYALSASREWGIQTETLETDNASLTVFIRRIANPADEIQFTVTLEASRQPI